MRPRILFVPGFAGSHLTKVVGGGEFTERLWLSHASIAWSGIERLNANDPSAAINKNIVRASGILEEVYQPFQRWCQLKGVELVEFGYDWRGDIQYNANQLAFLLERLAISQSPTTIIGHSMGGLIAAKALQQVEPGIGQRYPRLVTCATPWRGSFRTVELLTGKHDIVRTIVGWNRIVSRKSGFQWLKDTIRTVASWPGVYDMIPFPDMLGFYDTPAEQDPFGSPVLTSVNPWIPAGALNAALLRRPTTQSLGEWTTHINWRGIGVPTAGPMPTVDSGGRPDFYFRTLDGDGTVPAYSSEAPRLFGSISTDFQAEHEQFMNDPFVLDRLGRLLGI